MNNELFNERLRRVMAHHLDDETGSTYWLEKARERDIALDDIQTLADLPRFGPMDEAALQTRPLEDFIPKTVLKQKEKLILGETGGTLGKSKLTAYREDEFQESFVEPFVRVARHRGFPEGVNWLWIGPGGPHMIGKAARACARALGSPDPFSVNIDARWAKKLPTGSIAAKRYLDHVVAQAIALIETQRIEVLFSTPKVFAELAPRMSDAARSSIQALHFGGMPLDAPLANVLKTAFPAAIFISGYGNTLFGMCPEFTGAYDGAIRYFPYGDRILFSTVPPDSNLTDEEKLLQPSALGERGQIVFSRLDETFMILNMFERDEGLLVEPGSALQQIGFRAAGVADPRPLSTGKDTIDARIGLY